MAAPDLFVSFGVPNRKRLSYVIREEGKPPDFVLEVLSVSTWRHDIGSKKTIYERMGALEYWMVDPDGLFLDSPLRGYMLGAGGCEPVAPLPGKSGAYRSDVLELRVEENVFRIRDPGTGIDLLGPDDLRGALDATTAALQAAERRAIEAERHLALLSRRTADRSAPT